MYSNDLLIALSRVHFPQRCIFLIAKAFSFNEKKKINILFRILNCHLIVVNRNQ